MSAVRKLIGILLLIAALIGLIFSIAGITILWRVEPKITAGIETTVDLLVETLETTSQGLVVTQVALKSAVDTVSALETTVQTIATTIKSSTPMVVDIRNLITEEVPQTIMATETSLRASQKSAAIIDSVLGTLSSIPLIGGAVGYNPEVPLAESLGQVADSLSSLPDALNNMETSLSETNTNLETFQSDLTMMADSIGQISSSISEYDKVILGYKASVDQIINSLEGLKTSLPTYVRYLLLALTVFLVWMAVANLGLLTQGWELVTENKVKKEPEVKEEPVEKQEPDEQKETS